MKVKITEKPGVWPYVLMNDFKSLPYFAYEVKDDIGNRKFVRVLKAGPEILSEPTRRGYPVKLTAKRKSKISHFLRETVKKPLKYGEFLSQEWIHKLVEQLGLFKQETINVVQNIVAKWLKDECFKNLIQTLREGLGSEDAEDECGPAKVSEEIESKSLTGSQPQIQTRGMKRRQGLSKENDNENSDDDNSADDHSDSSDDTLFTPIKVIRKKIRVDVESDAKND